MRSATFEISVGAPGEEQDDQQWDAAEIIGVTDRTKRRWRERLESDGCSGLVDRWKGKPSD
jgi:hypothetical protein